MAFFQATGLFGTFNTIAGILISIRKCYKAKKKIAALVSDSLSSLENLRQAAPRISRFVEVGGIQINDFCVFAGTIFKIEVDLLNMRAKLERMNKIYRFCSAPESTAALESIRARLTQMETEMRLLITSVKSNVKNSVVLEALEPVLAVVEEISPLAAGLKDKQRLLDDARKAFGTHVLAAGMNRLISRRTEGVYYLIMGKMFYEGMGVGVDFEKSACFFQRAINYGNSEAFAYLGKQYNYGLGMIEDESKAVELFRDGAELEDPECLYEMGECFCYGYGMKKDYSKCFEYYTKAADLGHVTGIREVGSCLQNGWGTEVDLVLAAKYYKLASEAGDKESLGEYAYCMLQGYGVERNMKVSVALLQVAASAGSAEAIMRLGDCYRYGWGVEQDEEKAFCLYSEAADQFNSSGLARAGECLMDGNGVARDQAKGVRYIRKAAETGNTLALNSLAFLYRRGDGVEENKRKALSNFKRAAVGGSWHSDFYIAEMYRHGEGVDANIKKSIHHFEVYAKREGDQAHWNLACIFKSEEGHLNENRALYHFRLAAGLGHPEAREVVGEYFVSVSVPRKLNFTNDELQVFLRKSRRNLADGKTERPRFVYWKGCQIVRFPTSTILNLPLLLCNFQLLRIQTQHLILHKIFRLRSPSLTPASWDS